MTNTTPKVFFAYPSRSPTLKEAIDGAVPELNQKGQVKIKTWEKCNIGGKFVIDTICDAIDEAELFFADLTGLNANVMFELGYAIACDKRIWLILDDTYTKEKDMFEQLKILTTVGYVSCCNSQDIVSGFYKDKPFADIENTIFRAPIEPNLKPYSILSLKSQHENQAALYMSNLLQERFPEKIIVDAPNKPAVQSLADYGDLVFGCNGLVCHFTNPKREGAYLETARHALICGMARGFEKPLLMLAEDEFPSPIDYRDYLKHYKNASEALGYLEEWLPRVEQDLKADEDRFAGMRDPLSEPHVEQGLKADQEAAAAPRKIFITYTHQDTEAQKKLKTYLAVMEDEGKIELWDDGDITAGSNARQEHILKEVADSDILLYLASADSLASESCNKELTEAVRAEKRVIPIILESCDWLNDRLSDFQALPDKGNPINKWQPESDGWQNVVDGIREAVEEMQVRADTPSGTSEKELRAALAFQQGNVLMMIGQVDMAIEHYSHAIELNPNNATTYSNRGVAYASKGNYDRAIRDYTEAIRLSRNYVGAYNNRGIAYSDKSGYDRAIENYTKAIQLKPDYAEVYNNRGIAYGDKSDYVRAIENYTKAIQLKPDYVEAYNNRGVAYGKKGDVDHAIEDYTRAIERKSDYAEAYNNRGAAYSDKGEVDLAIVEYTQAIQLKPDYAEAYNNRGVAYGKKGGFDRAIEDYTKAIHLNPDYAGAYSNRGFAYITKGDYDRAIEDYTKAIDLNPDYAEAYSKRGFAYITKGEFNRAIEDFTKAIELNPNSAEAYNNRGLAYNDKGDYDYALVDLNKAIQLNPDYAIAYYNCGLAYNNKREHDHAIANFTKAIDLNPNHVIAYNNRGIIYDKKGDYDRAIADYTKVIEFEPNDANAYNNRGAAYKNNGELDRAIVDYTKAIQLNPSHAIAYYNRGMMWVHLRDWERAKVDLTIAKEKGIEKYGIQLPTDIDAMLTPQQ